MNRTLARRDETIAALHRQIDTLKGFPPDRPADLFAPVAVEIASLSRGVDFDGKPGDDGITVHLRLTDADGDPVKAPGRIRIQLVDNSELGAPKVIRVYEFNDPQELRKMWHSRFGTQHYTLRCPFPPDVKLPKNRRVGVHAEFVDFLTGATLTAGKEVPISFLNSHPDPSPD